MSERELRNQILVSERARTVAEDASKLKDEFLATMSHEIRTPLNAVLGWTQILRTQNNVQSRERALEVIERNAASQLRLVEDLLDMARIISGKLRLDITVNRSARHRTGGPRRHRARCRSQAGQRAGTIRRQAHPCQRRCRPPAAGDLERDVERREVHRRWRDHHVALTSDISTVTVVVSDTGQGIAAEFLPYVFDRFRQADGSPSRRHGGLGLGLALTRQIVELHGGSIHADSNGSGKGAEFSIRLPVADAMTQVAATVRTKLDPAALDGITVLIVDDSADSREMFEVALRAYGATVVSLDSADAALAGLQTGALRPDILLSDIGLPGSDGYDLIRSIRSLPSPVCSLPAIAITAYADPEDRIQALSAGYQLHLPKPTDPSTVADSILGLTRAAGRG